MDEAPVAGEGNAQKKMRPFSVPERANHDVSAGSLNKSPRRALR
jgi:hypothetical protein